MINHRRDKSGPYRKREVLMKGGWRRLKAAAMFLLPI
jgi:hypothetical protein